MALACTCRAPLQVELGKFWILRNRRSCSNLQVQSSRGPPRAPPGVDTRIHWDNEDEGWIGGGDRDKKTKSSNMFADDDFSDLLLTSSLSSHYE